MSPDLRFRKEATPVLKERSWSIFYPERYSRLFPARNIFRPVSQVRQPEKREGRRRRVTSQPSVPMISLCVSAALPLSSSSRFVSPPRRLRSPLKLRRDASAPLQIHTEQSNYCDNISAWLINCSLCASKRGERRFYIFLSSLFLPSPRRALAAALPLPIRLFLPFILQLVHIRSEDVCFSNSAGLFSPAPTFPGVPV